MSFNCQIADLQYTIALFSLILPPRHSMQEPDFHIIIHFVIFYPERWAVLHSIFFRTLRLPLIIQHKHATIH